MRAPPSHEIRQCSDAGCRFRFPVQTAAGAPAPPQRCPRCGSPTETVYAWAGEREAWAAPGPAEQPAPRPTLPLEGLLDNVRSVFNVGSIFRSADAAGLRRLYLCGLTPTPAHPKFAKTALGAQHSVIWAHSPNALETAQALKAAGCALWALEEGPDAASLFDAPLPRARTLTLVAGNELSGVDPALLAICDATVALPMRGAKRSLNVATAFGAAAVILAERMARRAAREGRGEI